MSYRVAVVGATGAVGREMMAVLEDLEFPISEIHAIASRKSMALKTPCVRSALANCACGFTSKWRGSS